MTPIEQKLFVLQTELNPIQDKRPNDFKWFEVDRKGKLYLRTQPVFAREEAILRDLFKKILNCVLRAAESIRRFFCNPYPKLEGKITLLNQQINKYLSEEN